MIALGNGRFKARLVRQGDGYGRGDRLTHDNERPMIEFYDSKYDDPDFPGRGQFVARYYLSTLASDARRRGHEHGLDMQGDVPAWKLTADELSEALMWAALEVSQ